MDTLRPASRKAGLSPSLALFILSTPQLSGGLHHPGCGVQVGEGGHGEDRTEYDSGLGPSRR